LYISILPLRIGTLFAGISNSGEWRFGMCRGCRLSASGTPILKISFKV